MGRILGFGNSYTSHWRYLAQAMEETLADVADQRVVNTQNSPPRLLEAANEFLQKALNADSGHGDDDPSVTIGNYRLAAQALRSSRPIEDRSRLRETLQEYLELLQTFSNSRNLSELELEQSKNLQKFFHELFVQADLAAHTESVVPEEAELESYPCAL